MQEAIPSPALPQSALLCHTLSPTELAQRPHWKPLPIVTSCSVLTYPDTAVCLLIDILFQIKVWNTHFFSFPKPARLFRAASWQHFVRDGWRVLERVKAVFQTPGVSPTCKCKIEVRAFLPQCNHAQSNCLLPEQTTQLRWEKSILSTAWTQSLTRLSFTVTEGSISL